MKKIKVLSLFSGIGAYEKALERLRIPFEVINYCENDSYPAEAYSLIHNIPKKKNLIDIRKINITNMEKDNIDLMSWSFPCTDLSVAGKRRGIRLYCKDCLKEFDLKLIDDDKCPFCNSSKVHGKNDSGLYFEGYKILKSVKPKYSIIENVKALTFKNNIDNFYKILKHIENIGYRNYYKVLNAKDYGIPQNRERVFIVSIRKDINQNFEFPKGFDSRIRLKHILEPNVDEKYYIPQERCNKLLEKLKKEILVSENNIIQINNPSYSQQRVYSSEGNSPTISAGNRGGGKEPCKIIEPIKIFDIPKEILNDNERQRRVYNSEGVSPTILARNDNAKIIQIGKLDMKGNQQIKRVYNPEGISPTLDTMQGGHRQPKVVVCDNKLKFVGGIETGSEWCNDGKKYSRNFRQGNRVYDPEGIACSLTSNGGGLGQNTGLYIDTTKLLSNANLRIRKLTPKECFRLMGFDDIDYYILKKHKFSDTRLYKMAGNSIVVDVLEYIFLNLFKDYIKNYIKN